MEPGRTLGETIKLARVNARKSRSEFAAMLYVKSSFLVALEEDREFLTDNQIKAWARRLNIDLSRFIC